MMWHRPWRRAGFSLVEVMVVLALFGILMAGVCKAFNDQNRLYLGQDQEVAVQQNLRVGLGLIKRDIRMAGYDPSESGNFGFTDLRRRNLRYQVATGGNGALEFTVDYDGDGEIGPSERVSYSIFDSPVASPDGRPDLARRVGGSRQLVAEDVEAVGFAFAFDGDGDGFADLSPAGHLIWAVDTDNDNALDANLDTNDDGAIDLDDLPGGIPLAGAVNDLDRIRAVRIWLLGRFPHRDEDLVQREIYIVGARRLEFGDGYRRRLRSAVVKCRNL